MSTRDPRNEPRDPAPRDDLDDRLDAELRSLDDVPVPVPEAESREHVVGDERPSGDRTAYALGVVLVVASVGTAYASCAYPTAFGGLSILALGPFFYGARLITRARTPP